MAPVAATSSHVGPLPPTQPAEPGDETRVDDDDAPGEHRPLDDLAGRRGTATGRAERVDERRRRPAAAPSPGAAAGDTTSPAAAAASRRRPRGRARRPARRRPHRRAATPGSGSPATARCRHHQTDERWRGVAAWRRSTQRSAPDSPTSTSRWRRRPTSAAVADPPDGRSTSAVRRPPAGEQRARDERRRARRQRARRPSRRVGAARRTGRGSAGERLRTGRRSPSPRAPAPTTAKHDADAPAAGRAGAARRRRASRPAPIDEPRHQPPVLALRLRAVVDASTHGDDRGGRTPRARRRTTAEHDASPHRDRAASTARAVPSASLRAWLTVRRPVSRADGTRVPIVVPGSGSGRSDRRRCARDGGRRTIQAVHHTKRGASHVQNRTQPSRVAALRPSRPSTPTPSPTPTATTDASRGSSAAPCCRSRRTRPARRRATSAPARPNGITFPLPSPARRGLLGDRRGSPRGECLAMPDNGFGAKANSADFLIRAYYVEPDFKTADGGSGDGRGRRLHPVPRSRRPDRVPDRQRGHADRLLTGADIDPESLQRGRDGDLWVGDEFGPWILHFDADGPAARPRRSPLPGGLMSPNNPCLAGATPTIAQQPGLRGDGDLAQRPVPVPRSSRAPSSATRPTRRRASTSSTPGPRRSPVGRGRTATEADGRLRRRRRRRSTATASLVIERDGGVGCRRCSGGSTWSTCARSTDDGYLVKHEVARPRRHPRPGRRVAAGDPPRRRRPRRPVPGDVRVGGGAPLGQRRGCWSAATTTSPTRAATRAWPTTTSSSSSGCSGPANRSSDVAPIGARSEGQTASSAPDGRRGCRGRR